MTKAVVRLKLIGGGHVDLQEGVPESRAACKDGPRPCGYVRCKFHLWRIDSDERAGNPDNSDAGTTLKPAWLEWPVPASCALDFADQGEHGAREVGRAMGMHRGNVWLIWARPHVKKAFEELRELLGAQEDSET